MAMGDDTFQQILETVSRFARERLIPAETEVEALTYASMWFRSMIGKNMGIGAQGIVMESTEAQKAQYLPGLATGELIESFALTEPDNGLDASHIRT